MANHPGAVQEVLIPAIRLAINLGDDRRDDRRPGRSLDDLQLHRVPRGDGHQIVSNSQPDRVALHGAIFFAREIQLNLRHIVPLPEIVVADQSVEIHRRGHADVAGEIGYFRHGLEIPLEIPHGRVRALERRTAIEVQHERQFVLVIKWKHFERHTAGCGQHRRGKGQPADGEQEHHRQLPRTQQRGHQRIEELVKPRTLDRFQIVRVIMMSLGRSIAGELAFEYMERQPWRDGEGHHHAHQHGHGNVQGHGPHVRSHHSGDEEHGEERHDDGQGRDDERGANFGDGFHDDSPRGALSQQEMPGDIFHIHDRIIHEQTQRQDQGEQRDPVDRVTQQQVHRQRKPENHGHGDGDDERLAPAQPERQQPDHDENGDGQAFDQIIDLFVGGQAIVAGNDHLNVIGHDRLLQFFRLGQYVMRDPDRVGTFLFGDSDGDGRVRLGRRAELSRPFRQSRSP